MNASVKTDLKGLKVISLLRSIERITRVMCSPGLQENRKSLLSKPLRRLPLVSSVYSLMDS